MIDEGVGARLDEVEHALEALLPAVVGVGDVFSFAARHEVAEAYQPFAGGITGHVEERERQGRNPQTGEPIMISARRVLTFKPSQLLKQALNADLDEDGMPVDPGAAAAAGLSPAGLSPAGPSAASPAGPSPAEPSPAPVVSTGDPTATSGE